MINIISDPRRPERRSLCENHLKDRGIFKYLVWNAIYDRPTVIESINASHKRIVKAAKEANMASITIAEDDVYFPSELGWEYYQLKMPSVFDIYLGGAYGTELPPKNPLSTFVGLHLYTISASWYDKFLSVPDDSHIDTAQEGGIFIVCYPFAAIQRPGWSANNGKEVDYNAGILRPWDIYH